MTLWFEVFFIGCSQYLCQLVCLPVCSFFSTWVIFHSTEYCNYSCTCSTAFLLTFSFYKKSYFKQKYWKLLSRKKTKKSKNESKIFTSYRMKWNDRERERERDLKRQAKQSKHAINSTIRSHKNCYFRIELYSIITKKYQLCALFFLKKNFSTLLIRKYIRKKIKKK